MANISKYDVLSSFGFTSNPFRGKPVETGDMLRIRRTLKLAIHDRGLIGIVGERGAGKSVAVIEALKGLSAKIVKVWAVDKRRMVIGDVEYALIRELSDEAPKRQKELRAVQLRTVLGQAARGRQVVLVIEEAHQLHYQTIRALKALRELAWMGEKELITVVLIGQTDALNKPGMAEIRLRSDTIHMGGLTREEIKNYLTSRLGEVLAPGALDSLATLPDTSNYLDLQESVIIAMSRAMTAGRRTVEAEDVSEPLKQIRRAAAPKQAPAGLGAVLDRRRAAEVRKEASNG